MCLKSRRGLDDDAPGRVEQRLGLGEVVVRAQVRPPCTRRGRRRGDGTRGSRRRGARRPRRVGAVPARRPAATTAPASRGRAGDGGRRPPRTRATRRSAPAGRGGHCVGCGVVEELHHRLDAIRAQPSSATAGGIPHAARASGPIPAAVDGERPLEGRRGPPRQPVRRDRAGCACPSDRRGARRVSIRSARAAARASTSGVSWTHHLVEPRRAVAGAPQQAAQALHGLPDALLAAQHHPHLHRGRVPALVEHLAGGERPDACRAAKASSTRVALALVRVGGEGGNQEARRDVERHPVRRGEDRRTARRDAAGGCPRRRGASPPSGG